MSYIALHLNMMKLNKKEVSVTVRLSVGDKKKLRSLAENEKRTLSNFIQKELGKVIKVKTST